MFSGHTDYVGRLSPKDFVKEPRYLSCFIYLLSQYVCVLVSVDTPVRVPDQRTGLLKNLEEDQVSQETVTVGQRDSIH